MCFGDVLTRLHAEGLNVNSVQLRWAINSGKVSQPPLDGSLRFNFGPAEIAEVVTYFRTRPPRCQQRRLVGV